MAQTDAEVPTVQADSSNQKDSDKTVAFAATQPEKKGGPSNPEKQRSAKDVRVAAEIMMINSMFMELQESPNSDGKEWKETAVKVCSMLCDKYKDLTKQDDEDIKACMAFVAQTQETGKLRTAIVTFLRIFQMYADGTRMIVIMPENKNESEAAVWNFFEEAKFDDNPASILNRLRHFISTSFGKRDVDELLQSVECRARVRKSELVHDHGKFTIKGSPPTKNMPGISAVSVDKKHVIGLEIVQNSSEGSFSVLDICKTRKKN